MGETPGSVVTLLCSGMHFFNAEKRIADCVLEDTAGVAAMTSAELARCSSKNWGLRIIVLSSWRWRGT